VIDFIGLHLLPRAIERRVAAGLDGYEMRLLRGAPNSGVQGCGEFPGGCAVEALGEAGGEGAAADLDEEVVEV
jgi:hypothetical protein